MRTTTLPLVGMMLMTACQRDPATSPAPTPSATASATPAATAASPTPTPTPEPVVVTPRPGALKTFGDWTVGCDNTRLCTMASLGPDMGDFPKVTLAVLRQPGPAGAVDLSFAGEAGDATQATAVTIDGRRMALPQPNGAPAMAVATAMANGAAMTVLGPGGRRLGTISLKGAAAALRWIDAEQGRAGTVTALVAKGPAAADTVPAAPPAPVVMAIRPGGTAEQPTRAQIAAMRRQAQCETGSPAAQSDLWTPESHALGDGATLVMLPCSAGAYNVSSALFILRGGKVTPARADVPTGFGETPAAGIDTLPSVVNGDWQDGRLTSFAKGRGLGDCGVTQTLVWDGRMFRLTDQAEMGECRGNMDYITTWRAQVVRRR